MAPKTGNKRKNSEPVAEEMADVQCIVDQRSNGCKEQYLCAWMDGAEPQWVDAVHLKGSLAERQWFDDDEDEDWDSSSNDAESSSEDDSSSSGEEDKEMYDSPDVVERKSKQLNGEESSSEDDASSSSGKEDEEMYDPPDVVERKCKQLKEWLKEAKRPVFLLGAGISAPVLPTFRGKGGLWTANPEPTDKSCADVEPTEAHKGLVELEKRGKVYWCVTQNYDGLSMKSGFPRSKLSELHGNIFVETCDKCGKRYDRDFEVPLDDASDHETGRVCESEDCNGILKDNIVHFDENLPWGEHSLANAKFVAADLSIVLGSSLRVFPAAGLPFKAKKRRRFPPRPKAVIVNLQATPLDEDADLIIRATCDDVISKLLED